MMGVVRRAALSIVIVTVALVSIAPPGDAAGYRSSVSRLPAAVRELMIGSSWRPGCPVPLRDLRLVRVTFVGFDGGTHRGKLVAHRWYAEGIRRVFHKLFDAGFPIRRMRLVDRYGANDTRSMNADNTSAFNCRFRDGVCCRWSMHAYGKAIDINPVENPYVGPWGVSPERGDDLREGSRVVGLPSDRLGVGRHLVQYQGLPALLLERAIAHASTHAATRYEYGSTAPPFHGCHSKWSWGPVASPVEPTVPITSPAWTYPSLPTLDRCALYAYPRAPLTRTSSPPSPLEDAEA
jgi:hypothetical protein